MTTTNNASPMTEVPQGWNFSASLCTDFRFQSETNLEIDADVFRLTYHKWKDEEGAIRTSESAFGREICSCGWYFVPPHERERLAKAGAVFCRSWDEVFAFEKAQEETKMKHLEQFEGEE